MQFSEFWGGSDQTSFRVNFHIVLQAKDKKDRNVHFQCGRRLHLSSSRASSLPLGVIERRRSARVRVRACTSTENQVWAAAPLD